jgi:hypothetical protein
MPNGIRVIECNYPNYIEPLVCNENEVKWFNSRIMKKIKNYGKNKFRKELQNISSKMYVNCRGTYNDRGVKGRRNEKDVVNYLRNVLCDEPNWKIIQASKYDDTKSKIDFWMHIDNHCLGIQMKIRNMRSDACYEIIRIKKNKDDQFKICMGRDRSDFTRASAFMSIGSDGCIKLVPTETFETAARQIWDNSLQIYLNKNRHNLRVWNRKNKYWMNSRGGKCTFRSRTWPGTEIRIFPCKNRKEGLYKGILYMGGSSVKKWIIN